MEKMWLASAAPAVKSPNNRSVGANYIRPDIPLMFYRANMICPYKKMPFKLGLNGIYFFIIPQQGNLS